MKNLVRPIGVKVVCDMYTCSNMAEFEVGHEFTPAVATHLCRECLRSVYDEAHEIFMKSGSQTSQTESGVGAAEKTEESANATPSNDSRVENKSDEVKKDTVSASKSAVRSGKTKVAVK